jgi:hypothetical protein
MEKLCVGGCNEDHPILPGRHANKSNTSLKQKFEDHDSKFFDKAAHH